MSNEKKCSSRSFPYYLALTLEHHRASFFLIFHVNGNWRVYGLRYNSPKANALNVICSRKAFSCPQQDTFPEAWIKIFPLCLAACPLTALIFSQIAWVCGGQDKNTEAIFMTAWRNQPGSQATEGKGRVPCPWASQNQAAGRSVREGWELSSVGHSFIRNIEEYDSPLQIKTLSEHTSTCLSSQHWGDGCRRIQSSKQAWATKLRHCLKEKNHLLGKLKRRGDVCVPGEMGWPSNPWLLADLSPAWRSVECWGPSCNIDNQPHRGHVLPAKWRNQMWCLCLPSQHLEGWDRRIAASLRAAYLIYVSF